MAEDAFDKLEESKSRGGDGDYASWWDPEEGDKLIGVVFEKHDYEDEYGNGTHTITQIRSVGRGSYDEGEEFATPPHTNLKRLLQRANVGDLVLVEYEGKEVPDGSNFASHQYSASIMTPDEWQETSNADLIEDVSNQGVGLVGDKSSDGNQGNSSSSADQQSEDFDDEVLEFVHDIMDMNDGEAELDEMDDMLNQVRDFGVDPAAAAEAAGYTVDGDTVTE